jgi:nitrogen-specific signal transduction histidine kinase
MNPTPPHPPGLASPPWIALRDQLLDHVARMAASGDAAGAAVLHALVEAWWREQRQWSAAARDVLRATHEINNALVGVSGSAQLLLLGPLGQQNGVRERLQVVLRESERVERAVQRLQLLRNAFDAAPADEIPPAAPRRTRDGNDAANAA